MRLDVVRKRDAVPRRIAGALARSAGLVAVAVLSGCGGESSSGVDDWRDQIVYSIVVDRFDDGDPTNNTVDGISVVPGALERFQGGDWRGLRRRLGYLERLGITALWVSPIVSNVQRTEGQDGYHAYWARDFTTLNERFGDLEELTSLVAEAHDRGMSVILDVVTNHAGRVFFYDFDGDGHPSEGEWYPPYAPNEPYPADVVVFNEARPRLFLEEGGEVVPFELGPEHYHRRGQAFGYFGGPRELGDFPTGLRDLDTENEVVIQALVDTYVHWALATDVDGFRLDAVPHVGRRFWSRFCTDVRSKLAANGKERFLLLGEVYDEDPEVLASYTVDGQFDSVFDFSLKWQAIDSLLIDGAPASLVRGPLEDYRAHYPDVPHPGGIGLSPWQARMSFADNHDMWRIAAAIDDPWIPILAFAIVYTVDAIPVLYYGSEQDFVGIGGDSSRERMWPTGFNETGWTYQYLARLAELRRLWPALRRGGLVVRYASEASTAVESEAEDAGLLVYERRLGDEVVLIALNANPRANARATVMTSFGQGRRLVDQLFGEAGGVVREGGRLDIDIPARSVMVLVAD